MNEQASTKVGVGTWVKLAGFQPNEEEVFRIVPDGHADLTKNEIPLGSPLARAIQGAQAGEKVQWRMPAGATELTVLEVGEL